MKLRETIARMMGDKSIVAGRLLSESSACPKLDRRKLLAGAMVEADPKIVRRRIDQLVNGGAEAAALKASLLLDRRTIFAPAIADGPAGSLKQGMRGPLSRLAESLSTESKDYFAEMRFRLIPDNSAVHFVKLANGVAYAFPKFTHATPEHRRRFDALGRAERSGDPLTVILAEQRLFVWMIRRCYMFPADECRRLVRLDYSAKAPTRHAEIRRELIRVAAGLDPVPATKSQPSTETEAR